MGVDGVNVGLLLMGAIVAFAAACASWEIREREKEFYVLLLLMTGGILGAFASLDLFIFSFYFFHELALVPTFIMIGVWGRGENKNYAAFQITLYLSIGALISLVGLIALYLRAGLNTFNIAELTRHNLREQPLSLGMTRISSFPCCCSDLEFWFRSGRFTLGRHSVTVRRPRPRRCCTRECSRNLDSTASSSLALPLMPQAAAHWAHILAWLCLGNIVYCGLVAMRQRNLNWLIGYSSVAHMGFAFLGIASLSLVSE